MRLNAKILKNVASVNQWEYADQITIQEGQTNEIYIQLIDPDKAPSSGTPMRYTPTGASPALEATFPSIDDAEVLVISASSPFTQDKSIWKITLSSTETPNSGAVNFKFTEGGVDKFFTVKSAILVSLLNDGGC